MSSALAELERGVRLEFMTRCVLSELNRHRGASASMSERDRGTADKAARLANKANKRLASGFFRSSHGTPQAEQNAEGLVVVALLQANILHVWIPECSHSYSTKDPQPPSNYSGTYNTVA